MERASEPKPSRDPDKRRGRGKVVLRVAVKDQVIETAAPPGSRFKGYEDFLVQDLVLRAEAVRYRRECIGRSNFRPPGGVKPGHSGAPRPTS